MEYSSLFLSLPPALPPYLVRLRQQVVRIVLHQPVLQPSEKGIVLLVALVIREGLEDGLGEEGQLVVVALDGDSEGGLEDLGGEGVVQAWREGGREGGREEGRVGGK
jgi:hypothetical protein